ncbi:hypothetical protein ACIBCT_24160 [Streptosporangium sp. NPDC050855]|uniref:hypothetical protein n=1 Tax=Streptosporangium sp. NPDC050855 TaxID=3366194 RepID=UPI0037B52508
MRLLSRPHQLPTRIAAGVIILNSGLAKRSAGPEAAEGLHGMAAGTYPFLKDLEPARFVRLLSTAEIALGAALLVPVVPSLLAGAALTAFAGGLLGLYLRTPGMREEGTLRPSQQGLTIAKDVWLLGIGTGLVVEEITRD